MKETKDEIIAEVFQSRDYEKFGYFPGNRDVNFYHVRALKASLKTKQVLNPIVVMESEDGFTILDGQHRLSACAELKLPVQYIIDRNAKKEDAILVNTASKNWSQSDYLNYYIKSENSPNKQHYVTFRNFIERHKITINIGLNLFSSSHNNGGSSNTYKFKTGRLQIGDGQVKKVEEFMNFVQEIHRYFEHSRKQAFIMALYHATKIKGFSIKEFCDKVKQRPTMLMGITDKKGYTQQIQDLYNFGKMTKNKVLLA